MRPIILLSLLRNILTISLIHETRSFVTSSISEQQIHNWANLCHQNPCRKSHYLWKLWHLSATARHVKGFNRNKLINILSYILTKCELHMKHALINDVILNVKIGNKTGPDIHTNIGICRGDCLSALLFILYLAFAVQPLPPVISAIDCQKPLWSALDWFIDWDVHKITIDPKYADDILFLGSYESKIKQVEREIPAMLLTEGLHANENKTERYHIQSGGDAWKKCKYLRSLLDTEEGIKRRKGLTIDSCKT